MSDTETMSARPPLRPVEDRLAALVCRLAPSLSRSFTVSETVRFENREVTSRIVVDAVPYADGWQGVKPAPERDAQENEVSRV